MGINETGKIDFAKYVNNDNFKNAKVTKESKFVANVFGEAVKTRAIASNEITMDGKLSVAEKDVLKNAVKNNVIQGLSAKELADLPDSELEQFAQYIDDLSNNKVPTRDKQELAKISSLTEANKAMEAKLEKLQASMDSVINVKDNEIKALNDKFSAQQAELDKIKAAEQKKAEAAKKQQAANSAVLNKTSKDYPTRVWTDNDIKRLEKLEERFSKENIDLYVNDYNEPDFSLDLVDAISKNPVIMRRLSKASDGCLVKTDVQLYLKMGEDKHVGVTHNYDDLKIKDILKYFETAPFDEVFK